MHGGLEQRAAFLDVAAREDRAQHFFDLRERNVGQEAEPPLVDADQGDVEARELARGREHRPVAADDDDDVRCVSQRPGLGHRIAIDRRRARSVGVHHDRMPAARDERRNPRQGPDDAGTRVAPDERDAAVAVGGGGRHGPD